ncbi:MAG: BlaI/MecI/CopY family transcriptional regulator [Gammaproteobacteria bacterium]|nr:CopY family transcriptional regulator [Gammaproteobacteria bacterium]MDP6095918.1 BlaI/MecI/CopY family transcriptional regulator [Gammaproteobacteria bacterium]
MTKYTNMSRRERQLMDAVYRLDKASAKEVMEYLDDGSSYSTIRTLLRKLVEKGHIKRTESGLKYLYYPVVKRKTASQNALKRVVSTFFDDSPMLAVNSLLRMKKGAITEEEFKQIEALIKKKK